MPVELPVKEELEILDAEILDSQILDMIPTTGSATTSIIDSIPMKFVLLLAAPYLAGRTKEDAIRIAHRIFKNNLFSGTLDMLGEDADSSEECDLSVYQYKQVIDAASNSLLPTSNHLAQMTVSMKPSMFSTVAPLPSAKQSSPELDKAYERIKSIVDYAFKKQVRVTLEAEDHRWTDFQLDTYFSLINEGYSNLGTVLQSRLFRTRNDIKRFDDRMRVRLVIGIYNEPAEIAHTEKPAMKQLLVEYAGTLSKRGTYIELASHDADCLNSFFRSVVIPQHLPSNYFETQFLMGVPRKKLQIALKNGSYFKKLEKQYQGADLNYVRTLAESGTLVRLYLPFGDDKVAGPYCKRRLKANPNMIAYGIKNLLHIQ